MCYLVDGLEEGRPKDHGLVWTFPENLLRVPGVAGDGYAEALRDVVRSAEHTLTIAAPYLEARGVGLLEEALVTALQRGVSVVFLAHDVADLSSMASNALRSLQSEARRQPGRLAVYTTAPEGVLLHLKIAVADRHRGLVGSANLTGKGLGSNVEVGARVSGHEAAELCVVVDRVIASGLAKHVFSTR
jgi:phosphatidylserine/phosphatidylglycerophosphate/cardiolipin synthase-like enzyme